jgi:hypothetical protein
MTLLGLPWGPLTSWDGAGKCFITLAAVISLLAASCLYLLLRIGAKPFFLVVAAVCVGASLGPYPHAGETHMADTTHGAATGLMADSLFAWTALAAILLLPYEAKTTCLLIRDAVLRGIIWGSILSLGVMTKLSFAYFIVFLVPLLFVFNFARNGGQRALAALIGFACSSAPTALYLLLWGRSAFENAQAASFGRVAADRYYVPLLQFLTDTIRDSPGLMLSFMLTAAALVYLMIKRRPMQSLPDFLALLIMIGFGIVVLVSPNRESRFAFPIILALPFLTAILMSDKESSAPRLSAALAAGLVFCGLLAAALPMRDRADSQSLARSDAILTHAVRCNARHVILATNSPTLNFNLIAVSIAISAPIDSIEWSSLPTDTKGGVLSIEEGFQTIRQADEIVFQNTDTIFQDFAGVSLRPWNQRVSEYERYIQQAGYLAITVYNDVVVYSLRNQALTEPLCK